MSAVNGPVYGDPNTSLDRRRRALLVTFAVAAVGALNACKAVHIDDALYLAIAKQIVAHPFDPYGFEINWQHTPQPAYAVSISPPLLSYWHAMWLALGFGDGVALHLMMIPWLALLGWGLVSLLTRVTPHAGLATAGLMLSPAVFAGTNLMLDVPMSACLTAGVECALRASDRRSTGWLVLACLLGSAGVLIKYPAIAFAIVCLLLAVTKRNWRLAIPALCCLAAFFGWQRWSASLYGADQVSQASSFLERFSRDGARTILERLIQQFALVGMAFPIWIVSFVHGRSRFAATLLAVFALFGCRYLLVLVGTTQDDSATVFGFQFAVFLGAFVAGETIATALRDRSTPLRFAMLGWLVVVVGMTTLSAPFIAVRYLLPAMPALLFLQAATLKPGRIALGVSLGLSATIGLTVAAADLRWANFYETTIAKTRNEHPSSKIHFAGHWGLQWYAEKARMKAWDARWNRADAGPMIVVARQADPTPIHPFVRNRMAVLRLSTLAAPSFRLCLRHPTKKGEIGTHFYGWEFPHLPWSFSSEAAEEIWLLEVR